MVVTNDSATATKEIRSFKVVPPTYDFLDDPTDFPATQVHLISYTAAFHFDFTSGRGL